MKKEIREGLEEMMMDIIEKSNIESDDNGVVGDNIDNLTKLSKILQEEDKLDDVDIERACSQINSMDNKKIEERRLDLEQKKHITDCVGGSVKFIGTTLVGLAGIVVPAMCYSTFMNKGFKFEKHGIYTSTTFKDVMRRGTKL